MVRRCPHASRIHARRSPVAVPCAAHVASCAPLWRPSAPSPPCNPSPQTHTSSGVLPPNPPTPPPPRPAPASTRTTHTPRWKPTTCRCTASAERLRQLAHAAWPRCGPGWPHLGALGQAGRTAASLTPPQVPALLPARPLPAPNSRRTTAAWHTPRHSACATTLLTNATSQDLPGGKGVGMGFAGDGVGAGGAGSTAGAASAGLSRQLAASGREHHSGRLAAPTAGPPPPLGPHGPPALPAWARPPWLPVRGLPHRWPPSLAAHPSCAPRCGTGCTHPTRDTGRWPGTAQGC